MRSQIFLTSPEKMKMFSPSFISEDWLWANTEIDDSIRAPNEYYCPITQELMVDPVIASDGHTYEKTAIKRWLEQGGDKPKSPMTNVRFESLILTSNHALRSAISQFNQNKKDIIQKNVLKKSEQFIKAENPLEKAEILMDKGGLQYRRGLFENAQTEFLAAQTLLKGMMEDNVFEQGMDVEFYINKLNVRYCVFLCEMSLAFIEVKIKSITNRDYSDLINSLIKLTSETNNLSKEIDKMLEENDSDSDNDLDEYIEYAKNNKLIKDELPQMQAAIGDLRFQQGSYLKSLGDYIAALSGNNVLLDPEFSARYHHQQGKVYSNLGCFDEAAKSITKAIELDGSKTRYYADRGRVYCSLGKFSKAIADFDFSCKYEKNNMNECVEYLVGSGYSKLMQATALSEHNPSTAELIAMLGSTISDYSAAIKLAGLLGKPLIAKNYYDFGVSFVNLFLLKRKNKSEEFFLENDEYISKSIENFNVACELDSNESLYYFAKGVALELNQDDKEAANEYKKACKISNRAEYFLALANIEYESNQFDDAEMHYVEALEILESSPPSDCQTLRWPDLIIYSHKRMDLSLLEIACQQQSSLDVHQIICINMLVEIYQKTCPNVLANIFLALYYVYEQADRKDSCINEEVYDEIFSTLANIIKDSWVDIGQSANVDRRTFFSSFELQVINYANDFLRDDKSLSKQIMQFGTTESRMKKFKEQAEILKNVAFFCYIHNADEPLAAIINHIYRNTNLLSHSFQPHLHVLNFADTYRQSTRKGLTEYGFISESRRREQQSQLMIDQLKANLVQQKQDVIQESAKRVEAEKRINELESLVDTNVKTPKNNACIVLINQTSPAYKPELNIEAVYKNFLHRVDRVAQGWEPSYYCGTRSAPLSISALKRELADLGELSIDEIKQKIVDVYEVMQNALDSNEKNEALMIGKYKLLCEEVENQFPALLESKQNRVSLSK